MKQTFILFLFISVVIRCSAQSLDEAKKLTENEQYEAAALKFQELIAKEPGNGTNYYFFGENFLLADNPDSAKIAFEKGLEKEPGNALNKIGLAKIKLDDANELEAKVNSDRSPADAGLKTRYEQIRQRVTEAKATIDEVVAAQPKNVRILTEAADALIHLKNKDLEKARTFLDRAQGIEPKNVEVKILLGDLFTELSNGTLAADYYNQALDLDKKSARSIVSKGILYRRSMNFDGASEEYKRAITVDPNYAPAYRELGEVEFKMGKLELAKENYRKYLDLSKNNCSARIRYATFLYFSRNYAESLIEISQLKEKCDPNNPTVLRISTYCLYETKEYAKGLDAVIKLFNVVPEAKRTALDYEYYGKLQIANQQDSLGVLSLRKAYEMDRSKTELLNVISDNFYKKKNYPEAIKALTEKIAIGKDLKSGDYVSLALSYYFNSQFMEADTAWKKVNELFPNYAYGWSGRARANTQIDSTSENGLAKPFYEKYIELAMADSANSAKYTQGLIEAYTYMAYYYILKKDTVNALKYLHLKEGLPLEPEDLKKVKGAIDQLEGRKPQR